MSFIERIPEVLALQHVCEGMNSLPYCTGTVRLDGAQSLLFYRSKGEARCIDFANTTEEQLKALADACAPASFGRNQEDVLDENYRKAGKLDVADFAAQFSPWDSGVLTSVIDSLFRTEGSVTHIKSELYKLNVYGPGSFFKAHVDTPRSDAMIGSLVVVLPTRHAGGSLLFRHRSAEYKFDSAAAVSISSPEAPHAAFATFFSDVEHEVAEVTSGYRVTITYNLYIANPVSQHQDKDANSSSQVTIQQDAQTIPTLVHALTSLLRVPTFLPDGGLIGFGLTYEYPFTKHSTRVSDIGKRLKGKDALLKRACEACGLQVLVKAIYDTDDGDVYCFSDNIVYFGDQEIEQSILDYVCENGRGVFIGYNETAGSAGLEYDNDADMLGVVWASPLGNKNLIKEKYITYGNEASLACAYARVCLVVRVKPSDERI